MNQYKEHIKRLRDDYNAAVMASLPFYDEPEDYRSWELDYEAHADACAEIVADACRKGDYAHMWEALNEALKPRDDDCDEELTGAILTGNHQQATMEHATHQHQRIRQRRVH